MVINWSNFAASCPKVDGLQKKRTCVMAQGEHTTLLAGASAASQWRPCPNTRLHHDATNDNHSQQKHAPACTHSVAMRGASHKKLCTDACTMPVKIPQKRSRDGCLP